MSQKEQAQEAIFAAITRISGELEDWNAEGQASILKNLAVAYRLAAGGSQPGSAIVS